MNKILIGISGGIDSAAATLRLREQGYCVTALWIDMLSCAEQRRRVVALCERLDVPLLIEDVSKRFAREVVSHTIAEHQAGRTPSPCAVCNTQIKWKTLSEVADRHQIRHIATGHYVRIVEINSQHYVARGEDAVKDQSYYLYALNEQILSRAVTPLGDMLKSDVRHYLASRGFDELAAGGESQGLCFVEKGYNDFLRLNTAPQVGEVIDTTGAIVGSHDGFQLYTIGQKRGFSLQSTPPNTPLVEVRKIDAANNQIEVGQAVMSQIINGKDAIFRPFADNLPINVAVRGLGRNPKGYANIIANGNNLTINLLDDSAWAVAPGQPVVLYARYGNYQVVVGGAIAN